MNDVRNVTADRASFAYVMTYRLINHGKVCMQVQRLIAYLGFEPEASSVPPRPHGTSRLTFLVRFLGRRCCLHGSLMKLNGVQNVAMDSGVLSTPTLPVHLMET